MIVITTRLLQCIDRCKIVECNEIILTNYRRYIVDFNLERYFSSKEFILDKINSSKLDLRQATHKAWFVEKIEKYIMKYKLYEMMEKICYKRVSRDQLEIVDNKISYILNKAR